MTIVQELYFITAPKTFAPDIKNKDPSTAFHLHVSLLVLSLAQKARLSTSLNGATQNNPYLQCLCYGPEEKGNTMKTHSLALWRASVSGTPDT